MASEDLPHVRRGPIECFILEGDQPDRRTRREPVAGADDRWVLCALREGGARLLAGRRSRRLVAPGLFCLQPGMSERIEVPVAASWASVAFTLRWTRRRRAEPGGVIVTGQAMQPDARTWFGVDLPLQVGPPHLASGIEVVRRAAQDWWLGDRYRARAGAAIAWWLFDWAIALADAEADDEWAGYARTVRHRMAKVFTVADLAKTVGCSRVQLFRRMRAELGISPSAWLARIRREEADRLLADPKADPDLVARCCGYASLRAFWRWYRRG